MTYPSHPPTHNFPSHLQPLCQAATHLRRPVTSLLRKISPTTHRLIIIHDSLMSSVVQDFVSLPNAESYTFHSVSAFSIALYTSEIIGQQIRKLVERTYSVMKDDELSFEGCFTSEFKKFIVTQHEYAKLSSGRIYNTCRVIEQPILELLEAEARNGGKLVWALGPFNPVNIQSVSKFSRKDSGPVNRCLEWLDKQASNSVILVSFGTTTSFTEEQIIEIAIELEKSDQKFVWVVREADRGDIVNDDIVHADLPEGMSMGVPIAAWPMHYDQPNNAVLVTKILKVGILVKDWCPGRHVVAAAAVETSVRRLMGSKEGEEIRKRAAEMGRRIRKSVEDGGVTQMELESFIAHARR
ncbi:hypothetical protein L1987_30340 [Smallanthus sonchifolius]|uniref:Uncharacterized protein n=1 Tax=Smallanthus sonchifolius TaxID=185202 RepID=A0ACB9I3Z0_9ASTR|nr:hypothetical protein L1987_30340 [Smallanthus sonchifolius]